MAAEDATAGGSRGEDPLDGTPLCCLVGPTACGKTALALAVAERAGAEVLSLDSMLVYRGMDVGTAKPNAEDRARVPHHLIDLVEPSATYDVQRYLEDARSVLADLDGGRALFVGGTGFYLMALVHGLMDGPAVDPELRAEIEQEVLRRGAEALHEELAGVDPAAAQRIHPNDSKRLVRAIEVWRATGRPLTAWQGQWPSEDAEGEQAGRRSRIIHLDLPDEDLDRRIAERTRAMLDGGWPEEALAVRDGPGFGPTSIQALGYREVLDLADGMLTREEASARIVRRTRRFSRRQRTWYRRFPGRVRLGAADSGEPSSNQVVAALDAFGWS